MAKNYCINSFYRHRTKYHHYDDSEVEDQWQLEVYLHALGLMKKNNYKSIIDVGCGSAYKLMTYFEGYETIGLELPVNVEILKKKYPDKTWIAPDYSVKSDLEADVVICADVIEHLVDPDDLLKFIKSISFKYLIMSTPDRGLIYKPWQKRYYGPPRNRAHMREWTFKEFENYISQHFKVIDHRVTNLGQFTQMVICEK